MSVKRMIETDLGLESGYLEELARRSDSLYRHVLVGNRCIDAPTVELKLVQTWIADFIKRESSLASSVVTAYEEGSSIVRNASLHKDDAHALLLDIHHFFQSCTQSAVEDVFMGMSYDDAVVYRKVNMNATDAGLLAKLCCRRGALVIGSPSSPFLANRIMVPVDKDIQSSIPVGANYTRYSDDICISSNDWIDIELLVETVSDILDTYGFSLNDRKTHCYGRGDSRRITGVCITSEGKLTLGPERKKALKRSVYRAMMGQEAESPDVVLGHINYCKQVDPDYLNRLLTKYSSYGLAKKYGGVVPALRSMGPGSID